MNRWIRIRAEELDLETTKLDAAFWSSVLSRSQGLGKVMPKRVDQVLGGDLFTALYDWEPTLKAEPPDPAMAAWLTKTMEDVSFQSLHFDTMGDKNLAAAAAVRLYRELMRPQQSELKAIAQTKDHIDQVEAMTADMPGAEQSLEALKQVQQQLAEGLKGQQISNAPSVEMNKYGRFNRTEPKHDKVQSEVSAAAERVQQDLEQAQELSEFEPGNGASLNPNLQGEKVLKTLLNEQLTERITAQDKVRKVLAVAGRMRLILEAAKSRKPQEAPPPVDLTFGADISNVLPSELANLADPELEGLFWKRYADKGLLQYDHKERPRLGKGPFICCLDVSGSMRGQPEVYALALFVSMARMAVKQHRRIVLIPFASRPGKAMEVDSVATLLQALDWRDNIGFGTVFETPLDLAAQLIATNKYYGKADILFITDGISSVSTGFKARYLKQKHDADFRLIGVGIDSEHIKHSLGGLLDACSIMQHDGTMTKLDWLEKLAPAVV